MPNITFDNFYDEVKFYCHGQPKKAAGLGEIVTGIDHPLAQVWIDYANDKGWPQRAEFFRKMLVQGNSLTMPCANPSKFDPEYRASGRRVRDFVPEHVTQDFEMRREVSAQVMATMRASAPPKDAYRKGFEEPKPKPPTLAELAAMPTPPMSDALRSKLGMKPAETQEEQGKERAA